MKLKIFISYSHLDNSTDNQQIEAFKKHLAPLKNNGLIEEWYDRKIVAGEKFNVEIDSNLLNADIICLFISANFLSSSTCIDEKKKALELRKKKGVPVIPIILSSCGWLDDSDISELLALPNDGKPISGFNDKTAGWQEVYEGLKGVVEKERNLKKITIKKDFNYFLHDAEMFTKAHSKKERVCLKDIYINTELEKFDSSKKNTVTISSDELLENLFTERKVIIAGEDQSGKTTLCKRIFCELRSLNLIPVYVSSKKTSSPGKIDNFILKSLYEQYDNIDEKTISSNRIIPIIDDFHLVKDKEKYIKRLVNYSYCIIVVDDIFSLNLKDETLISLFITFRIKQLKPSIIYELIKKWVSLTDKEFEKTDYKDIDKNVELINTTLGRNIGKGLIPAYPYFILSTLFTYDTFALSLDQDITSQGHCYQAFIYYYLTQKRGVKNDEIDIYSNFLSELASFMHHLKLNEISYYDFSVFLKKYSEKYNLPIKPDILLTNLSEIILEDSFKNYSFKYPCFYYYFVAKSLSEHADDRNEMKRIENILNNLHVDENAYIAVFLVHHSKNIIIFDEINKVASSLFNKYESATLTKNEMSFFDEQAQNIVKAALPPANVTPEMVRTERLKIEDQLEESKSNDLKVECNDDNDTSANDIRRAIKTVEVIGCIIRNRAGSLEKDKLQNLFLNGMNVHLRALSSLIEIIRYEDKETEIVELISKLITRLEEGKDPNQRMSEEKRRKIARNIFWNVNFFTIYGIIYKIVHSLGSDKLIEISNNVCDQVDTPASFLIKHGILMGYPKNLQIPELEKRINEHDFSKIAKRVAEMLVVDHCSLNLVTYRDKQRIEDTLKISKSKLN
jgi:hypothetical protein